MFTLSLVIHFQILMLNSYVNPTEFYAITNFLIEGKLIISLVKALCDKACDNILFQ